MPVSAALLARGLVKDYRRGRAVDGVDLTVKPGERVALLGPNGAGKTTTLLMCLGAVTPDAGTVEILGHRLPRARTRHVGFRSPAGRGRLSGERDAAGQADAAGAGADQDPVRAGAYLPAVAGRVPVAERTGVEGERYVRGLAGAQQDLVEAGQLL